MSRIAIIGSGVSGAVVARLLSARHEVILFEAASSPGGHARTVNVQVGGQAYPVDTGFMVFNDRTYPNFCRLLDRLGVASRASDMSFSVRCQRSGLQYQGSSPNGLFAQRRNLVSRRFWRMLRDVARFNRKAIEALECGELSDGRSVGDFLNGCRVGEPFVSHYLAPMAAAIWSSDPGSILAFPAEFLIGFFANHGLLQLRDRPQWRTIVGGSRAYVQALLWPLGSRVRLNSTVESAVRTESEVLVTTVGGVTEGFDQVVFACHADQALAILRNATPAEVDLLSAFPYQANQSVLHTDASLLPTRRRAWASWNYLLPADGRQSACVTYDLSRLQGHRSRERILLSLNPCVRIEQAKIIEHHTFHHPAYSAASIAAQQRWREISGHNRTHYCGAYWGNGFHEDGVNSSLAVAASFGLGWESCEAVSTKASLRTAAARP